MNLVLIKKVRVKDGKGNNIITGSFVLKKKDQRGLTPVYRSTGVWSKNPKLISDQYSCHLANLGQL